MNTSTKKLHFPNYVLWQALPERSHQQCAGRTGTGA